MVVPVYGVEEYLGRCLESLLGQSLRDIEVVLVDDGSPDRCPELCDEWARRDPRVKVVHKANQGLGMACNSGMDAATSRYVAFCDSDDWVDRDMYAVLYETAVSEGADAVYSGLKRVNGKGDVLGYMPHPQESRVYECDNVRSLLCDMICQEPGKYPDHGIQVSAKTVLYDLDFLRRNGLRFVSEREYPSEDLVFNASVLAKARKAVVLDRTFYNYFVNDDSITTTLKVGHFDGVTRSANLIEKSVTEFLGKGNVPEDLKTRLGRFIIGECRSQARMIINSGETGERKRELLRELSRNEVLRQTLVSYPLHLMPLKQRLVLELIRGNRYRLLKLLFRYC